MRVFLISALLVLLLVLAGCGDKPAAVTEKPAPPDPAVLEVGGLTCMSCQKTIAALVHDKNGVSLGYTDLTAGTLELHFTAEAQAGRAGVEELLNSKGFRPTYWPARPRAGH